jgi:glycerophosphoryl diester phosphodiesterase
MAIEILAHRGWWEKPEEKNTLAALARAFDAGLGVETDLRDCSGELVVSHDPPIHGTLLFRKLLEAYTKADQPGYLALNVKADGLQPATEALLGEFAIKRYFMFDMSIPDQVQWLKAGVPTFTRHSEFEKSPVLYDRAAGVWLDGFETVWFSPEIIKGHLKAGKMVSVISPELHGRDPVPVWKMLQPFATAADDPKAGHPKLFLCTDRIAEARRFFHV